MGCHSTIRKTSDPDEVPFWDLPDTPLPGSPRPTAPDGQTVLTIPDWSKDVRAATNKEYFEAAVAVVFETQAQGEQ